VLTIKPRQTYTQCYRVIQLRSVSTRSIEGRDLYSTEIISHIGERVTSSTDNIRVHSFGGFIKCHRVCRNNNEVSFITNLLLLHVTNAGKFRLNMNFWLSFIEEETNKLLRRYNMFPFFIWTLVNTQQTFLESSYERIQKIRSHSSVLCNNKKENWRYLKYSCYPRPKRERCITRKQKIKEACIWNRERSLSH